MVTMEMATTQREARTAKGMTIAAIITSNGRLRKVQDQTSSLVTSRFTSEEVQKQQEFRMVAEPKGRPTLETLAASNSITKTCK